MTGNRQLSLELRYRPALGREDFLQASCNAQALAWIDLWPSWPASSLIVYGPPGCGKTHLAHVFAARSQASFLAASSLSPVDPPHLLQTAQSVVIEDVQGDSLDEKSLLHLYNGAREAGIYLLLTADLPPARWGIALPDLRSRLLSVPCVEITPPDDSLLEVLLVKLFADRQLSISQDVLAYLVPRMERSFAAARHLVAEADRAALSAHRTITIPLLRSVLENPIPEIEE